jgi:hypothetical protein
VFLCEQVWAGKEAGLFRSVKCFNGLNVRVVGTPRWKTMMIIYNVPRVAADGLSVMGFMISGSHLTNSDV